MISKSSKHVNWCLKKAQKEIEECKKQGTRPKHRGLIKVKTDKKIAKEHLDKAKRNLEITEYLLKGGFGDASIGSIFYSMYQCFIAMASKYGYESGNQTCTIALIEHLKEQGKIEIDNKFIEYLKYEDEAGSADSLIELREEFTYSTKINVDAKKITQFIDDCKELVDITKEIVFE